MGTAWQSIRDGDAEQMLGEGLRNGPLCGTPEEDFIAQSCHFCINLKIEK